MFNANKTIIGRAANSRRFISILLSSVLLIILVDTEGIPDASAQFPPMFPSPPLPWNNQEFQNTGSGTATDDRERPKIELMTTQLNHGKNVLVVEITDASYLRSRQVKYVEDGKIALADLARDHDNVYYALVNVTPPSSIIEIEVIDSAGNRATVVEEIPVGPPLGIEDMLSRLMNFLGSVISNLRDIIGTLGRNS